MTGVQTPPTDNFVDLLSRQASEHDDKAAFVYLEDGEEIGETLSYASLRERAHATAVALGRRHGVGTRILLLYPSCVDYMVAFFGCLCAGMIAVPVFPPRGTKHNSRLEALVRDSGATVALTTSKTLQQMRRGALLAPDALSKLDILCTDLIGDEKASSWQRPDVNGDTVAFLQYTSGSTGQPKGVMVTHGNLLHNERMIQSVSQSNCDAVYVTWLPIYHDMGLIGNMLHAFWLGATCYFMAPVAFLQKPVRWLNAISRFRATISGGPNFAYQLCSEKIDEEARQQLDLSSWEVAFNGAEPVRRATLRQFEQTFASVGFRHDAWLPCYGMAESTLMATGGRPRENPVFLEIDKAALSQSCIEPVAPGQGVTVVGCGRNLLGQTIRIVDPDTRRACQPDRVGEIWLAGPHIGIGYWQRPDVTQQIFQARIADTDEGPFLRTGDTGFMHGDELYVTGRLKDMIIIRGENYHPHDIESAVEAAHPAFKSTCCAVVSVERGGEEKLVVVQELIRNYAHWTFEEMFESVRRTVGAVADLPVEAIVLIRPGTTPKTSSGKIQRAASKAAFVNGELREVAKWVRAAATFPAPSAEPSAAPSVSQAMPELAALEVERYLAGRIAEIVALPTTAIDVDRPFSEYGLGSLEATQLSGDLAKHLRSKVAPTAFYDHPSIRQLAQHLTQHTTPRADLAVDKSDDDAVVVVGIACRFPAAPDAAAYWQLLAEGKTAVTTRIGRDGAPRHGGFIDDATSFDHDFFGIKPREAAYLDPQQRIALEVAWHALEDAGIVPAELAGTNTGVFFGASAYDYGALQLAHGMLDAYSGQGSVLAVIANRIAYQLDLRGPSFSVDTACSSGLTAVHLACRSLRDGECDMAMAGGVNLLLAPDWDIALEKAGMLSPDGLCKTFDASANGYVRGEGCGVVVLKRYADAVRDGNQIYGAILGSALNQDGRSNGLTAPNGSAQESLLRASLQRARVSASQLSYIEAHGTGTPLGDPIECAALRRVLGQRAQQCWMGSAKANIGHLEAAAGIAGLIKVLLAMRQNTIPRQANFHTLNPLIDLGDVLAIPATAIPWNRPVEGQRYASVSAFGFSGANANVIVGDVPQRKVDDSAMELPPALPFILTARDRPALRRLALQYSDYLPTLAPEDWPHMLHTSVGRRTIQKARFAAVVDGPDALASRLRALAHGNDLGVTDSATGKSPKLAFVFSGQGIPLAGVGRDLHERFPVFRQALERCDTVLAPSLGRPLASLLYDTDTILELSRPALVQPVQFSLQYALAETLLAFGIRPDVVMGHSLGEYAALVVAHAVSLDDALRLVAARGELTETHAPCGAMAAVFAADEDVLRAIQASGAALELAAINGKRHCVVAGAVQDVSTLCSYLSDTNTAEFRRVPVERAYHSALMEPVLSRFEQVALGCTFSSPRIEVISNVNGEVLPVGRAIDAGYLMRHLRQPVRFADSLETMVEANVTIAIEIGSKPVLSSIGQLHLEDRSPRWVPALRHNGDDWRALLECLGQVFMAGVDVDWAPLFDGKQMRAVSMPPYPFEKNTHWFAPRSADAPRVAHGELVTPLGVARAEPAAAPTHVSDMVDGPLSTADALAQMLGRITKMAPSDINRQQTFLELGVDSIMLMEFAKTVTKTYEVELSMSGMFEHYPSIQRLAAYLNAVPVTAE